MFKKALGIALAVIAVAAIGRLAMDDQPTVPDTEPPLGVTVEITHHHYKTVDNPCWRIDLVDVNTKKVYSPCVSKYHYDHGPVGSRFMWTQVWRDGA